MEGEDPTLFDREIAAVTFPPSVGFLSGSATRRRTRRVLLGVRRQWRRVRKRLPGT
jgi:hypothetical protein